MSGEPLRPPVLAWWVRIGIVLDAARTDPAMARKMLDHVEHRFARDGIHG